MSRHNAWWGWSLMALGAWVSGQLLAQDTARLDPAHVNTSVRPSPLPAQASERLQNVQDVQDTQTQQDVTLDGEILTAAEQETLRVGLSRITEARVRETIQYLASDELAGRDTLSPGFETAADYVIDRFKQVGLRPGAGEDFNHITKVAATRTPQQGIVWTDAEGQALPHLGLLGAAEAVDWQGKLTPVDLNAEESTLATPGPVWSTWSTNSGGPRVVSQIIRAANRWRQAGATAVLLQVPRDHPLIESVQSAGTVAVASPRTQFTLPVLLIPTDLPQELTGDFRLQLPAQETLQADARNVIAILPGSDPNLAEEYILFSAHLDHIGTAPSGEDRIFNGADDNATGVTAVLSLAEAFAALPQAPKRSLVFMVYWGEERGLLGSRAFVRTPSIPLDKIVANINIEMIGRPEEGAYGKTWVTGWDKSDLGPLMQQVAPAVGVDVFEHPRFSSMLYGSSDNFAFAEAGVIAHSFSAGSLHEDYHQVTDEWEKLNLPHMTKVIQGLMVGSWRLVQGEATPQATPDASNR